MPTRRLSADWVVPIDDLPGSDEAHRADTPVDAGSAAASVIAHGAVLIGEDGRIAAVGPDSEVPSPPGIPTEHFPGAALIPGLINAHTHLELTGLGGRLDEPEFPDWIRAVRRLKAVRTPDEYLAAAQEGLRQCFRSGVTTVADTGDTGGAIQALQACGGSGIAYHEVFGPDPAQCVQSMTGFLADLERLQEYETPRARLGVSPHAPYSVSGPLYRAVGQLSGETGRPVAVHVAESAAESALLADGTGAFAGMWRSRGIPLPQEHAQLGAPGMAVSPIGWLDHHGVLGPGTLCIHAIRLSAADLELVRQSGAAVVSCPASNLAHGHGWAPLDQLLSAGIRVGLGTDSELSIGALDLWAEARLVQDKFGLSDHTVLRMLTLDGARAIGLARQVGSLAPGRWGDVVAVGLGGACDAERVAGRVLAAGGSGVRGVWLGGRPVLDPPTGSR